MKNIISRCGRHNTNTPTPARLQFRLLQLLCENILFQVVVPEETSVNVGSQYIREATHHYRQCRRPSATTSARALTLEMFEMIVSFHCMHLAHSTILLLIISMYHISEMAPPKAARTAYSLYFRYCKNMYKNPTLRIDFECNIANRELYKSFIRTVLNDQGVISSVDN
jgi:hypothetical protein